MKKLAALTTKISEITKSQSPVTTTYRHTDDSVQAELRLACDWSIRYAVDHIAYPKNLARDNNPAWNEMWDYRLAISAAALLGRDHQAVRLAANSQTKSGGAKRAAAREAFEVACAETLLSAYRTATGKRALAAIRAKITDLQGKQKALLPSLRRANSEYLAQRKTKKASDTAADTAALESGKFWEASKEAIKNYFRPPFSRNYLADVSEKWRAALYMEMDSTAWKSSKGDWRHKNVGTGRGYLCGIDDNGDEWGHGVDLSGFVDHDQYGDSGYCADVADAVSALFGVPVSHLNRCTRQGDLLFCAEPVPANVELHEQADPWDVRESHQVESIGLERNGRYLRSAHDIFVTHTSHAPVTLPAGSYRLYTLADAD